MSIHFTKMHGCGNDFIIINHQDGHLDTIDLTTFIKTVCKRKFGVGANGLMLLEKSQVADFKMRYFNADGSVGEMCGNGARCIARFAYLNNITGRQIVFETDAGNYEATIHDDHTVTIYFPDINKHTLDIQKQLTINDEKIIYNYGTFGVPHTVIYAEEIESIHTDEFEKWGRNIRQHPIFKLGTNVDLVEITGPSAISIRTYERGVEEETLACGSGACASAIITALLKKGSSPFQVKTLGGLLFVDFKEDSNWITNLSLRGNAVVVYEGKSNINQERTDC